MFNPGDKVIWQKDSTKTFRVTVSRQVDSGTVELVYKTKKGKKKYRIVSIDKVKLREPEDPGVGAAPGHPEPPLGWTEARTELMKEFSDRFGVDVFNFKVLSTFDKFWTKRVPGDGWCLMHSVNALRNTTFTHDDLRAMAVRYQPDFDDKYTYNERTGQPERYILLNELIDPDNLSETWVTLLAKEINCRVVIFTCQSRIDAAVTADPEQKREAKPKMDVWSYTAREVRPYKQHTYDDTIYLYNNGHYWPLMAMGPVNAHDVISIWGNETLKQKI